MADTAVRRDTITLDPNVPRELVLKYQVGKPISNGNVMFTTAQNEVLFVKPEVARQIHELGLQVNEPFRIMKRVVGSGREPGQTTYIVSRVFEEPTPKQQPGIAYQATRPTAAPATVAEQHSSRSAAPPPQTQDNSLSRIMASSYIAAMDALMQAKEYADSRGLTFRVTEEEIRASANSIFIEFGKQKERALRQREFDARYPAPRPQAVNGGASWQQ
jgi:hypothetical protein